MAIKRGKEAVALLAVAVGMLALVAPPGASAAETTYTLEVPTGQIAGYEVKQDINIGIPKPPGGGWITKMETDIVDATTGDPVPISRLMLHHIVFLDALKQDSTCDDFTSFDSRTTFGLGPRRFYAAGEERAKLALPPGYGYRMNPGDLWAMTFMVMNHRAVPDNALIQYKVTVETDPQTPVTPYWLDVNDCRADPIYNVPGTKGKGSTSTATRDYTIPTAGRIIGGAGHVHGGARSLSITKPDCGNAQIAESVPTWGRADHPFYNVRPILHEPGPINMSAFQSQTGIPVSAGERIRLNSMYDNSLPHVRVMGIFVIYIANDPGVTQPCGALPGDVQTFKTDQPGRPGPIPFKIPLTGLDPGGNAVTIKKPGGYLKRVRSGTVTQVRDRFFGRRNIEIKRGASLTWQFSGNELHNLTLANGPVGIGTDNLDQNRTFTKRFGRPGTYRFFCALHPVQMSQRVVVKGKKKKAKKRKKKR
jgi:plastocyanin